MKPIHSAFAFLIASLSTSFAEVRITEFLASNDEGLKDDDGDRADWIEIHNSGAAAVNLEGWSLTDDSAIPGMWKFPPISQIKKLSPMPPSLYRVKLQILSAPMRNKHGIPWMQLWEMTWI